MPRHSAPLRSSVRISPRRSTPADLRVTGPAELVQAVPFLVGFHPHDSLVLVGLHDRALVVTARMDIRTDADTELEHAVGVLLDAGVSDLVALVYDRPADDPDTLSLLRRLSLLTADTARVLDVLVVAGGRWRSLSCDDDACCPRDGSLVGEQTSAFAAAATVAGMVVQPDRAALAAVLEPAAQAVRMAVLPIVTANELEPGASGAPDGRAVTTAVRRLFVASRRSDRLDQGVPDSVVAARLAAYLRTTEVRDAVWLGIDDGRLDGRPLWAHLARVVPSPYDAAPAFLYGWAAWRAGNGAMASVAVDRARTADPAYSAADLLAAAISRGLDPSRVPRLRRPRCRTRTGQATRTKT